MHDEHIHPRSLTHKAVDIEGNAFGKAVDVGFHLDQLRVHVIGPRLGHGRQRIGRDPRPGRNADVASFTFPAQISKRIVNDVNLGGRVQCSHSRLAVAAENDGPHVARPRAVAGDGFQHCLHQLVAGVIDGDAIHFGRIE